MKGRVACIGAGTVGHAWAVVFARAGYEVALHDAGAGQVANHALPGVRRTLELLHASEMLSEPVETVLRRVHDAATIADAVAGALYVQESVREDVTVKREVFAAIASAAPPAAILASSTSAIPGSEFLGTIPTSGRARSCTRSIHLH